MREGRKKKEERTRCGASLGGDKEKWWDQRLLVCGLGHVASVEGGGCVTRQPPAVQQRFP